MTTPVHVATRTLGPDGFRKSSFCSQDACVEVAFTDAAVVVRDGKDRLAPTLRFSNAAWRGFVQDVAVGRFS